MKRITALTGMVVALMVVAAPAATASTSSADLCQTLFIRISCE